jgi:hypothetical protein
VSNHLGACISVVVISDVEEGAFQSLSRLRATSQNQSQAANRAGLRKTVDAEGNMVS